MNKRKNKNSKKVLQILEQCYPDAQTELNFKTPFQLLIATMLAAQTTDKQVNKTTKKLFGKYKTPFDFSKLQPEELEQEIKGCGLYKNKSKNIIMASKILVEKFAGKLPESFEELVSLPGVGRKTANVVLSNAFNKPAFAVDTHVFRVSNRIGLACAKDVLETEKQLRKRVPKHQWSKAHHLLIYHGRRVCRARNPKCNECKIKAYCNYYTQHFERREE
ncbi:MAG: endonuclease [Thermosediminibacterales bacterium]|nr:endonuclease [Thermosediminibacterales bacterium]